ncbi:MAG: hypothetical protein ACT4PM_03710 [Gemmatimonadales bacterium]
MRPTLISVVLVGAVLMPGQPGAGLQQEKRKCSAELPPSHRVRGTVYRDCDVDRPARLRSEGRLEFTAPPSRTGGDWACEEAELTFVVDTAGKAELGTARVVATTSPEFAAAVVGFLPTLRYRPALLTGTPVRQVVAYRKTLLTRKRTSLRSSQVTPEGRPPLRC